MRGPILRHVILVSVVIVGLLCSIPALSRQITVEAGQSIQDAIDRADKGDTIVLSAGRFPESVQLRCDVHLQGQGQDLTTIESSGRYPAIYAQGADGPTVSGVTIRCPTSSNQAAVYLEASVATISECTIIGEAHGCAVVDGSDVTIEDCTIENCAGNGVGVWDSRVTVERCVIRNNGYNAVGVSGGSAEVRDCELLDNTRAGIHFDGADGTAEDNVIAGNQSTGVAITGAARPTIRSNTIRSNKFGCIAKDGAGGVIERCVIYANTASGVLARDEGTTTRIDSNTIVGNEENGVFVLNQAESEITRNIIVRNGSTGIDLRNEGSEDGTPAKVSDNCVWGNAEADYDGMAPSTSDRSEDPLFADPEAGDFRVRAMSPCRDFDPFSRPIGALPEWLPLREDSAFILSFNPRPALRWMPDARHLSLEIALEEEAAGFTCKAVVAEEEFGGFYAGQPVVGPDPTEVLTIDALGEQGEGEGTFEWPFAFTEGWIQLLVAARPGDFPTGDFVAVEPVKIERPEPVAESPPADETRAPGSTVERGGDDWLYGGEGNDMLFCTSGTEDGCLRILFSPAGAVPVGEFPAEVKLTEAGVARFGGPFRYPDNEPWCHSTVLLSVELPAVACCTEVRLGTFGICLLTEEDARIDTIQLGSLSDDGAYDVHQEILCDLMSSDWRCWLFELDDVSLNRALLLRFFLQFGPGGGGILLGNMGLTVTTRPVGTPVSGSAPPGLRCGSLCVGTLESVFASGEERIDCADRFDLTPRVSEYVEAPPTFLAIGFRNNCDQDIVCESLEILDASGNTIWSGSASGVAKAGVGGTQEWARWTIPSGAEGTFEVVAQTNVGTFRRRFTLVGEPD